LQAGGQRFDPVQLHQSSRQFLIHCFQIAAGLACCISGKCDADLETGCLKAAGFSTALGRAVRETDETVWMFDNEIDWVMRIGRLFLVLPAVRRVEG
jgi:hypothetical protein